MFIVILANFFVFLFGLCIGSFLNCIIYRLEQEKTLKGRSFCPECKHNLSWKDLFPVFSWVFLGGKCRYCKKKISIYYPIIELVSGVLFVLVFNFLGFDWKLKIGNWKLIELCLMFYITSSLIVIFVYDLKHYLIPDVVLFPAIIITFLYRLFENLFIGSFIGNWELKIGNFTPLISYFFAVIIASGFFLIIFLLSKGRAMGFGDVKLAILMGLLLGFPNILVALFLAFFFGAIIGIILMVFNRKSFKSEIPFGPFLITGTFITLFFGEKIINWYFKMFLIV